MRGKEGEMTMEFRVERMSGRGWRVALLGVAVCFAACDSDKLDDKTARPDPARPGAAQPGEPVAAPSAPAAPDDVAAPPAGADRTASGLASKVLKLGSGKEHPGMNDLVEVHYTGWTPQGKVFDSSVARGETTRFPLGRVIKGWTEGLQLMTVGEKRRFWIPGKLAYGDTPAKPGALSGMLVFDVELISFRPLPPPAPAIAPALTDGQTSRPKVEKTRRGTSAARAARPSQLE
jgi:hypothetical protein